MLPAITRTGVLPFRERKVVSMSVGFVLLATTALTAIFFALGYAVHFWFNVRRTVTTFGVADDSHEEPQRPVHHREPVARV